MMKAHREKRTILLILLLIVGVIVCFECYKDYKNRISAMYEADIRDAAISAIAEERLAGNLSIADIYAAGEPGDASLMTFPKLMAM
jgi:hypothetical protein